jgi:hypothetical protein
VTRHLDLQAERCAEEGEMKMNKLAEAARIIQNFGAVVTDASPRGIFIAVSNVIKPSLSRRI